MTWLIRFLCLLLMGWGIRIRVQADLPSSTSVKRLFREPPRAYAPAPLWVWNDQLTEEQIVSTLRDLASQEVKQVFVHPRPGLMTPYLSTEWFELWRSALREAKKQDMNIWIYDENSYPSGFAGGFVPEVMPESRGRGLIIQETKTAPGWTTNLVAVFQKERASWKDVSRTLREGASIREGAFLVASLVRAGDSPWTGGKCYVDLLYPGVTQKFLELTLEPYRREFGDEFGRRIPGVFTDEPNIKPTGGLPWTDDLPDEFVQRRGYSLIDNLPSLIVPSGDWKRIRHDYFRTLHELFVERWAKPYFKYCSRTGLEFTGHYWDHEWPNCLGVPDNMAMYAWHQRPAVDILMNQFQEHTHAQFGNIRIVKELSSAANQLGKSRTLCEAYGAGGWDLRFEDMKRIGDWMYALGVNTMDEHLSYITLRGARKRDHPQSFSYHEPWWPAYHVSARYFSRLSAALSSGEQVNSILVLEPTTTAWMYNTPTANDPHLVEIGQWFFELLQRLEAEQVEYDLGCEDIIARHGSVVGSRLVIGKRSYAAVVLPAGTENLMASTFSLLDQFLKSGGILYALGDAPSRISGDRVDKASALFQNAGGRKSNLKDLPSQLHGLNLSDGIFVRRASGDQGLLLHHRRQFSDGNLLFLVNTSLGHPARGHVQCQAPGAEVWDPETGKIRPFAGISSEDPAFYSFELPPVGSLLLFLANKPVPVETVKENRRFTDWSAPTEVRRLEPNVLVLDFVDVTVGSEQLTQTYFYRANQLVFRQHGLDRNPWDNGVQFRDEFIRRIFPSESGFQASYRFSIQDRVPEDLAIVIERPDLYSVECNGAPLQPVPGLWWLDRAFGRISISRQAKVGNNVITLTARPFTISHEIEPIYVLGGFSLAPAQAGFVITPERMLSLGQWNEQGMPFYGAGVSYRQNIHLPQKKGRYHVRLSDWRGSVAEVRVNGHPANYLWHPPYLCEVTEFLRKGWNQVEVRVIGTLKNTLGPHHNGPGLGSAWPGMFQKGPDSGPPPPDAYATVGYGLFQPFIVQQSESN